MIVELGLFGDILEEGFFHLDRGGFIGAQDDPAKALKLARSLGVEVGIVAAQKNAHLIVGHNSS